MGLERESAAAIEPLLARAVGDSQVAAEGSRAIQQIMLDTEVELASIQSRSEAEAGRLGAEAGERVRALALDRRRRVAAMRGEITARASALALRFEAMLDMLEATEREVSRQAGGQEPVRDAREGYWLVQIRRRLQAERQGGAAMDPPAVHPPAAAPSSPVERSWLRRRRLRWWRRPREAA